MSHVLKLVGTCVPPSPLHKDDGYVWWLDMWTTEASGEKYSRDYKSQVIKEVRTKEMWLLIGDWEVKY